LASSETDAARSLLSAAAHAKITVDGRADEADWANARRFGDFVQIQPLSETPVPERFATEAMLLSTPEGIAVNIRAKQPKDVPRTKSRIPRDADGQMDRMNFMVDFDGEGRSGFDFTVTAGGDASNARVDRLEYVSHGRAPAASRAA